LRSRSAKRFCHLRRGSSASSHADPEGVRITASRKSTRRCAPGRAARGDRQLGGAGSEASREAAAWSHAKARTQDTTRRRRSARRSGVIPGGGQGRWLAGAGVPRERLLGARGVSGVLRHTQRGLDAPGERRPLIATALVEIAGSAIIRGSPRGGDLRARGASPRKLSISLPTSARPLTEGSRNARLTTTRTWQFSRGEGQVMRHRIPVARRSASTPAIPRRQRSARAT
jgi:hypothetical protein